MSVRRDHHEGIMWGHDRDARVGVELRERRSGQMNRSIAAHEPIGVPHRVTAIVIAQLPASDDSPSGGHQLLIKAGAPLRIPAPIEDGRAKLSKRVAAASHGRSRALTRMTVCQD